MLVEGVADGFGRFMHEALLKFKTMSIFSVASVDGAALGGGSELAALCDYRVMHENALLGFVQSTLGVSPGSDCIRISVLMIICRLGRSNLAA